MPDITVNTTGSRYNHRMGRQEMDSLFSTFLLEKGTLKISEDNRVAQCHIVSSKADPELRSPISQATAIPRHQATEFQDSNPGSGFADTAGN